MLLRINCQILCFLVTLFYHLVTRSGWSDAWSIAPRRRHTILCHTRPSSFGVHRNQRAHRLQHSGLIPSGRATPISLLYASSSNDLPRGRRRVGRHADNQTFADYTITVDNDDTDDEDTAPDDTVNAERQRRSHYWIVLVDDEASIRRAVGQLLRDQGYQVTTCADAAAAWHVLQFGPPEEATADPSTSFSTTNSRRTPDLLVSDIRMPGTDGLEFLHDLRSRREWVHLPVILLTARGQMHDRVAGYDAGADAYLSKPFDPDELMALVDAVLTRRQALHRDQFDVDELRRDVDEIKRLLLKQQQPPSSLLVQQIDKTTRNEAPVWIESTRVFLAPDERQVLEFVCQGLTTREIAERTYLSTRRVEQLLTVLFRKTAVRNRTELVRWAIATGTVLI